MFINYTTTTYSGCSSLSRASAEPGPGWAPHEKTATTAFEVICGWSVAGAVFYDVIITACCRRSACRRRLLVARIPQLDHLT